MGHLAKAIDFAKWSVWVKIKMAKNMRKTILRAHESCSVQKTALKKTKYSTNESILKMGCLAKAIEFGKWSVWVKN